MDYMTLIAEHDRIDKLCGTILMLVSGEPRAAKAVALLHELASEVDRHLAAEDRLIYEEMWPGADPESRLQAKQFENDFGALKADWTLYLTEWTEASIEADWEFFSEQSWSIITRVRERVRRENELLYPTAFRAGYITLKPTPRAAIG
jgi:hypothetical protein